MLARKKVVLTMLAVTVALVAVLVATGVAVAGGSPPTGTLSARGCSLRFEIENNFYPHARVVIKPADSFGYSGDAQYNQVFHFDLSPSGRTFIEPNDRVELKLTLQRADNTGLWILDTIDMSDCETDVETTYWCFSVLDMGDTTPYSSADYAPCGVFDVCSWGAKTVDLTAYPNCSGDVTVMCLDGEGNWTDTNIHNFTQDGTVVQWTSTQDGTCAFFEK
jgi:hypothetical protein